MSKDLRTRASSWHFTMSEEVSRAILDTGPEYPLWAEPSEIIGALAAAGLATRVDGQRITIVGGTDDSEWIDSKQVYRMLELLAPFSDEDSFVEIESAYDDEPSRWVLRDGKVVGVSPRITWPNPRDIGGWGLDADSVRAELKEASQAHGLDPELAEAIVALPDATINAAIHAAVCDLHWGIYDSLRSDAINALAHEVVP